MYRSENSASSGEVKASEPLPNDQENARHDSGPVGVQLVEQMDPYLLADPSVVSGWVKKELGSVNPVKVSRGGLALIFLCVCCSEGEGRCMFSRNWGGVKC
jgi:hypothetical protein